MANPTPHIVQLSGFYPPHMGGLQQVVYEISHQLAEDGYDVTVFASSIGSSGAPRVTTQPHLKEERLPAFEFAHTPVTPTLAWKLMRVPKPAVFHFHYGQVLMPEIMWLVAKLRRIPYVFHFHLEVEPTGSLGFLFIWYKKHVLPRIMRDARHVVALSEEQEQMIENRYGVMHSRISFLPNGVSNTYLKEGQKSRVVHEPLRLLFVGRLSVQKRADRIVQAMPLLKVSAHLTVVGDGEEREHLEALAEHLELKNITFTGALSGEDLVAAYREADLLVLPSDREGMPLVMLEAMATGLPVIGSDVQGIREHLAGVGVLVANPSPAAFAASINQLCTSLELMYPKLSAASVKKANEYSWARLTEQLEALYEGLVAPTR